MTRVGSLCSGYGGLELGLLAALGRGDVAWHAEYDPAPAAILKHHWPHVPNLRDVTTVDWSAVEPVDWLTAGYPCQPFSLAGKRKGSSDERHLWPHVADAIGVLRPGHVLLENVAGHVSMGLDRVLADLDRMGYVGAWGVVRASDAGAPHGRSRVFVVAADAAHDGRQRLRGARRRRARPADVGRVAADAFRPGLENGHVQLDGPQLAPAQRGSCAAPSAGWGAYGPAVARWAAVLGRPAPLPTEPGTRGQPRLSPAFVEWMQGLPEGHVTAVPGLTRNAQLKALGNGVVPQQAALAVRVLLPILEREAAA